MSMQLADGVITIEDLKGFDEKLRNILLEWAGMKE
jgi:hypothetical protein